MAFSIPWLETVSKRERQRREEKAQRLMFPFGDEQRTAESAGTSSGTAYRIVKVVAVPHRDLPRL